MRSLLIIISIFYALYSISLSAQVIFINVNNGPDQSNIEIAEAKKVAKDKGEEIYIIPPENSGITLSNSYVDQELKKLKAKGVKPKTLVISGHHSRLSDNCYSAESCKSSINIDYDSWLGQAVFVPLFESLKENGLNTFTSLVVTACNSTTIKHSTKWLKNFPFLLHTCGYIDSGPSKNTEYNLKQINHCLSFALEAYKKVKKKNEALTISPEELKQYMAPFTKLANFGTINPDYCLVTICKDDLDHEDKGLNKPIEDLFESCQELEDWLAKKYDIIDDYLRDKAATPPTRVAMLMAQFHTIYNRLDRCQFKDLVVTRSKLQRLENYVLYREKALASGFTPSIEIDQYNKDLRYRYGDGFLFYATSKKTSPNSSFIKGTLKSDRKKFRYIGDEEKFKKGDWENYVQFHSKSSLPGKIKSTTFQQALETAKDMQRSNQFAGKETFIVTRDSDPTNPNSEKNVYLLYK